MLLPVGCTNFWDVPTQTNPKQPKSNRVKRCQKDTKSMLLPAGCINFWDVPTQANSDRCSRDKILLLTLHILTAVGH